MPEASGWIIEHHSARVAMSLELPALLLFICLYSTCTSKGTCALKSVQTISMACCPTKTTLPTCSLYLSGRPLERTFFTCGGTSHPHPGGSGSDSRISVPPFEMQQWQKCRLLREFSRPDELHKRQILCPREGRQLKLCF